MALAPGLLCVLVALVVLSVPLILLLLRRKAPTDPVCGRCGYNVRGLPSMTCPECGSDLREVGIRTARKSARTSTTTRLVFQLALLGVAVAAVVGIASAMAFNSIWPVSIESAADFTTTAPPLPQTITSVTIHFLAAARIWGGEAAARRGRLDPGEVWSQRMLAMVFDLPDGQPVTVDCDLIAQKAVWRHMKEDGSTASGSGALVAGTILDALRSAKISNADARVSRFAEQMAQCARNLASGDPEEINDAEQIISVGLGNASGNYGINAKLEPGLTPASLIACVLLWGGGAMLIVRKHRHSQHPAVDRIKISAKPAARTLTVMFSDIQGYTEATAASDRRSALDLVRRHRKAVEPVARRRGGQIVKSVGDGLLLIFESATDAVCAGLEIQTAASADAGKEALPLNLRIGIATGELILADGDVFGDAVNLASRVQQLAERGGVLVAESTAALLNQKEVTLEEMGEQGMKGIANRVRVYRAVPKRADSSQTKDSSGAVAGG